MKKLSRLVREAEKENPAHQQAVKMGLKYSGFGYWKDPQTGEVKYKTQGQSLVPVDDDNKEAELAGAGSPDGGGGRPGPMGGMGDMRDGMGMGGPAGMGMGNPMAGQNVGDAPEPGQEQPLPSDMGWEPGPDGDTCAGPDAQSPGEVPEDSFVGRFNNPRWKAGPDGTNFMNISYEKLVSSMMEATGDQGDLPLSDAGYEEKEPTNRARKQLRKIVGAKSPPEQSRTTRDARSVLKKGLNDHPAWFGSQVRQMMKIAGRDKDRTYDTVPKDRSGKERVERNKEHDMWKAAAQLPAKFKDVDAVSELNKSIQPLLKDPNYDLDNFDEEDHLDGGAFGQVYMRDDGNVVKRGMLGPKELAALHAMRDNPAFPTLINARFDSPFMHKSSYQNNPMGADNEKRPAGESQYWNPDDESDFDRRFPGAEGVYAMTQASGSPLYSHPMFQDDGTDEDVAMSEKARENFWKARRDLHKAGFSHNDMHGGNLFVDDDGNVQIIDLGLADDDPVGVLMEALGGSDPEQGNDWQLSHHVSGSNTPERYQERFLDNRANVEQMLMDNTPWEDEDYDDVDDEGYSPTRTRREGSIIDMLRGDIRMTKEDRDQLREDLPWLKEEGNVRKLINLLYTDIGNNEMEDRMADAFDRKKQDTRIINTANKLRAKRGEDPIEVRNKDVIPPENLDDPEMNYTQGSSSGKDALLKRMSKAFKMNKGAIPTRNLIDSDD